MQLFGSNAGTEKSSEPSIAEACDSGPVRGLGGVTGLPPGAIGATDVAKLGRIVGADERHVSLKGGPAMTVVVAAAEPVRASEPSGPTPVIFRFAGAVGTSWKVKLK